MQSLARWGVVLLALGGATPSRPPHRDDDGHHHHVRPGAAPASERMEVSTEGPSRGPRDAPVVLVVLTDFQCAVCRRAESTIERLVKAYGPKLRVVYRDFPWNPQAFQAAEAAWCAEAQGRYAAMRSWLFASAADLSVPRLKAAARRLKLDGTRFDACLDSAEMTPQVNRGLHDGNRAGAPGTPMFFINGRLLVGNQDLRFFKAAIDEELRAVARPG